MVEASGAGGWAAHRDLPIYEDVARFHLFPSIMGKKGGFPISG